MLRKCSWHYLLFYGYKKKPTLLNPDKGTSVVCACVYLHIFLHASNSLAHIYTPQGSLDMITPEGTVIDGQWRKDEQGMTSYYSLPRVAHKPNLHKL